MMQVYGCGEKQLDDNDIIGVAIKESEPNQQHIGFTYIESVNGVQVMLDLAWHNVLLCRPQSPEYFWVDVELDDINKAALVAFCESVFYVNGKGKIPYGVGIDVSGKVFDSLTGQWIATNEYEGLTCATFVMAVFEAQAHQLLDVDTWEHRDSDKEWQEFIIGKLEEYGASTEHIEYQKTNIGAFRFRPEEVAGSAPQESYPVNYTDALTYSQEILKAIT